MDTGLADRRSHSARIRRRLQRLADPSHNGGVSIREGEAAMDLIIRNGEIVDGTGAPKFRGDVGVKDGRIVAVGEVEGAARRTIDAAGAGVAPGFVDIHTHYDGQVSWDALLAPSWAGGVTSTAMGNCGVGFAPARAERHDFLNPPAGGRGRHPRHGAA